MASKQKGSKREGLVLETFTVLMRAADSVQKAAFSQAPIPKEIGETEFEILEALLHVGPLTHTQIRRSI